MIEYNCALYLSKYLNDKKINVKNSTTNKNALLMIETRPSLSLILVIRNALDKIKDANLVVVGNEQVFNLINSFFGKDYLRININMHRLSSPNYNQLCIDENFWKLFTEEKIFIFNTDSLFLRSFNFLNFNYGMIGAIAYSRNKDDYVMNGGFSVRDKSLMLELCKFKISDKNNKDKGCVKGIFYEDVYFTNLIRENYPKSLPSLKECDEFAIESFGDYTKAIGIHGTDKYYAKPEFYKKIFQYLNNNKK
jgi:hypothetical protein